MDERKELAYKIANLLVISDEGYTLRDEIDYWQQAALGFNAEAERLRSRISELEYELQVKDATLKMIDKSHGEKIQRLDELQADLTTTREALGIFANENNWSLVNYDEPGLRGSAWEFQLDDPVDIATQALQKLTQPSDTHKKISGNDEDCQHSQTDTPNVLKTATSVDEIAKCPKCGTPYKAVGMPDFPGDDYVCTMHYEPDCDCEEG